MAYNHAVKWEPTLHGVAKNSAIAGLVCVVAFVALASLASYIQPGAKEEGSEGVKKQGCLEAIYSNISAGVGTIGVYLIPVACIAKLVALLYTSLISSAEELMNQSQVKQAFHLI